MRYTATDYISAYVYGNKSRMAEMAHEDTPSHLAWAITEIVRGKYVSSIKDEQALFESEASNVADDLCSILLERISKELQEKPEWARHHKDNPFYK